MKFDELPDEILGHIFESFTAPAPQASQRQFPSPPEIIQAIDRPTLLALCLTSHKCCKEAQVKLYRHLPLSPVVHVREGSTFLKLEAAARSVLKPAQGGSSVSLASIVTSLHVCWSANHAKHGVVLELIAALPYLSYLSLDFEHRGTTAAVLPVEVMFSLLEQKPRLETLNLRFTEVDVQLERLYVPACLRFRLAPLRSLRLKGVPNAALRRKIVHPLPNLEHLHIEYFDLPPAQLTAYIETITSMTSLKHLSLVDLDESPGVLAHLPARLRQTLERLVLDLDSTNLALEPLAHYSVLRHLQLGHTAFSGDDVRYLPASLVTLQFHPGCLEQVAHLAALLTDPQCLPQLRAIRLCGSYTAFWAGDEAQDRHWLLAKETVSYLLAVADCRGITIEPERWLHQLEERQREWRIKAQ